jgi:hypothetical protein
MNSPGQTITAYLVDVDTGERMEFQYNPNEITDEKGTAYAAIKVPGMSHPRYQFVAGEARKITFKVEFFKGPVKDKVRWLQSLQYPEHDGTMLKNAPHRVLFIFGDLFPGVVCIVPSVKARFFHLFDQSTLAPQRAEVDITLEEYVEQSKGPNEART